MNTLQRRAKIPLPDFSYHRDLYLEVYFAVNDMEESKIKYLFSLPSSPTMFYFLLFPCGHVLFSTPEDNLVWVSLSVWCWRMLGAPEK